MWSRDQSSRGSSCLHPPAYRSAGRNDRVGRAASQRQRPETLPDAVRDLSESHRAIGGPGRLDRAIRWMFSGFGAARRRSSAPSRPRPALLCRWDP